MTKPAIPGFEIIGTLGEGGMGTVYLARQLSLNRRVAVKVLPPHLAGNQSYLLRFRQEARAAAAIKHTNIVQIYDAGEQAGLCYFVMEYVDGETVGRRLARKGRLDQTSALLIAESVAVALEYAWAQAGLVHRDIKPDNLLIDGDGTVKVADLGLAKIITPTDASITLTHIMIGTPHYCAPEQARGEHEIDCRADIYALGAALYHMLTGGPPFADTSGITAMVRNVTDYIADPLDCNPDLASDLAWLLEKMMAKDKALRYRNWHETLDDLEQVLKGRPLTLEPLPVGASTVLRGARRQAQLAQADTLHGVSVADGAAQTCLRQRLGFRVFIVLAVFGALLLYLYVAWFRPQDLLWP